MPADLLDNSFAVATVDLLFAGAGVGLAWFGPWPRDGWFPARTLRAMASLTLALGVVRLWALR